MVNNADWTAPMSYLEFLRDVGKHHDQLDDRKRVRFARGWKATRDSYTEFSYMLLQAFDFYHLRNSRTANSRSAPPINGVTYRRYRTLRKKLGASRLGAHFSAAHQSDGTSTGRPLPEPSGSMLSGRVRTACIIFLCKSTTATS